MLVVLFAIFKSVIQLLGKFTGPHRLSFASFVAQTIALPSASLRRVRSH